MPAGIVGLGSAVPERVLTNRDLERIVETSDEWIRTRTGIRERRVAAPGETTTQFGLAAARRALERARVEPEELDLIIVATSTPDTVFPATAVRLQAELGATRAAGFDLYAACSGFVYGVDQARHLVEAGAHRKVLVVGVDLLSRITDWSDRSTCVLFGDAAGAALVGPAPEGLGILASRLGADGRGGSHLYLESPYAHHGFWNVNGHPMGYTRMNGQEIFKFAVRLLADETQTLLQEIGAAPEDVDLFVPHQANIRIIDAAAERLGLRPDQVFTNLDRYGNTSTASIPLALDEAWQAGRLKPGSLVVSVGFGGGLTWGAMAFRWALGERP
ncbi:beta-ketoacyl-ACP synthase III [Limnochorda pilosa]|uniref:Beta-ketoacyl-[acyl-carrier-protein] synthase III n=1 Tax=Limnochorda pilosa TaxID=1555112 RepID=A0A0K2SK16_LIMPI|nr:beta-ketoacyl-ACP synthase III [Limnochorda pilosa]BAS27461.1 3-oxoacyl-ACP synthase [Limnochorda pilosa]